METDENGQHQKEYRSNSAALMRFFSVDADTEMNISSTINEPQIFELRSREFILKLVQLITGFVCIGLYSEGLKLTTSTILMMFPNIVFSSYIIITGVIVLSCVLGCQMPEVLTRMFNMLGMILYFASATATLLESILNVEQTDLRTQRMFLLSTSLASYFNMVFYASDVYFSVKKALQFNIK